MNRAGMLWGTLFLFVGVFARLVDLGVLSSRPDWMGPLFLVALGGALLASGLISRIRT